MAQADSIVLLFAVLAGVLAAVGVLLWLARKDVGAAQGVPASLTDASDACAIVLDGSDIRDISDSLRSLLPRAVHGGRTDWEDLVSKLRTRFPAIPRALEDLPQGETTLQPLDPGDPGDLSILRNGNATRITLSGDPDQGANGAVLHKLQTARTELSSMRQSIDRTPNAIWMTGPDGQIEWTNTAYRKLAEKLGFSQDPDPSAPPRLFEPLAPEPGGFSTRRDSVTEPGGDKARWYDICAVEVGNGVITFAMNVDTIVNAEIAQRNFVQTLTKTFAHLSIGLAIFNRDRQLALFNPALVDLTDLPVDFLSARPTILCFFDMLRENQTMPEPKNYSTWRERIGTLVAAASDGTFQETWSLPSGQTYRVTGRPHPDGAVAFLFEDISHEVSLTRSFRSELALGNAVLNEMDEAVAVFTADGILAFSNAGFRAMWGVDPDSSFADTTITDALAVWRQNSRPNASWDQVEHSLTVGQPQSDLPFHLLNGEMRLCRVRPLINGARMVMFATPQPHRAQPAAAV